MFAVAFVPRGTVCWGTDCFSMPSLLLCSGDVETNPSPKTRSADLLALDILPNDPTEQMNVVFHLLKELQSRSIQAAKSQADLEAGLKTLQAGQKKRKLKPA